MSIWSPPPTSKSEVKRAGKAISAGTATPEDFALVDQWRSAHGYVINTFQIWLRRKIADKAYNVEFAQRLKRRNTVIDKLQRFDEGGLPLIADVSTMHDFAGCRMIFDNLEELRDFRDYVHSAKVMKSVRHQLRHDPNKYDYIEKPRPSGYRGIHDVYKHFPRGSDHIEAKKPWDGLLVEIQYRTRAQHAWATAVEISDLVDGERTKFDLFRSARGEFFALASEIIARRHENIERAFPDDSTSVLQNRLRHLEAELGILKRLSLLKQFEDEDQLQEHTVLNVYRKPDGTFGLDVIPFKKSSDAISKATELEKSEKSVNAVYVRSERPKQLRSAYRNYFNDPIDFVKIIEREGEF